MIFSTEFTTTLFLNFMLNLSAHGISGKNYSQIKQNLNLIFYSIYYYTIIIQHTSIFECINIPLKMFFK